MLVGRIAKSIAVQEVLAVGAEDHVEPMMDFSDLQRQAGGSEEKSATLEAMVDQLKLDDVPVSYHDRIKSMLKKHVAKWKGQLGEINITKHRIETIPGARPVSQPSYRHGPTGLAFE